MNTIAPQGDNARLGHFILYVTLVLTVLLLMFPPFTSLNGTERAFVLTGPEWSRSLQGVAEPLGLSAQVDWISVLGQLAGLWAISLGSIWFLSRQAAPSRHLTPALAFALLLFTLVPAPANAQIAEQEGTVSAVDSDATVGLQGGKYGVGFASTWPSYGLSGTYQLSEMLTAEAVVGFFGAVRNFGARGWYRFNRSAKYDFYGYAGVNMYQYRYRTINSAFQTVRDTESVLGLGAGVGMEAGIRSLFKDQELPPIFLNWELGLALASFEYYNFSSFVWGGGIHYRFGAR